MKHWFTYFLCLLYIHTRGVKLSVSPYQHRLHLHCCWLTSPHWYLPPIFGTTWVPLRTHGKQPKGIYPISGKPQDIRHFRKISPSNNVFQNCPCRSGAEDAAKMCQGSMIRLGLQLSTAAGLLGKTAKLSSFRVAGDDWPQLENPLQYFWDLAKKKMQQERVSQECLAGVSNKRILQGSHKGGCSCRCSCSCSCN